MDLTLLFVGGLVGVIIGIVLTQLFNKLIDKKAKKYYSAEGGRIHREKGQRIKGELAKVFIEGSAMYQQAKSEGKEDKEIIGIVLPALLAKYPTLPVDALGFFDSKEKRSEQYQNKKDKEEDSNFGILGNVLTGFLGKPKEPKEPEGD